MLSGILCTLRRWDFCWTSDLLTRMWRPLRLQECLSSPVEEVNRLIDDNQKGPTEILGSFPKIIWGFEFERIMRTKRLCELRYSLTTFKSERISGLSAASRIPNREESVRSDEEILGNILS